MGDVSVCFSVGGPFRCWAVGNPRERWPREGDFCRWLAASTAMLAECIGVPGLEVTGREVAAGEQVLSFDRLGRQWRDDGVRPDFIARDAHGRAVVIEAQIGDADHDHLGKLMTYAQAAQASVAVWAVAAAEPPTRTAHPSAASQPHSGCPRYCFTRLRPAATAAPRHCPGAACPSLISLPAARL